LGVQRLGTQAQGFWVLRLTFQQRREQMQGVREGCKAHGLARTRQQPRNGLAGLAACQPMPGNGARRGAQIAQQCRQRPVHLEALMRRDLPDEGLPDQFVSKAVTPLCHDQHARRQRGINGGEGRRLRQSGQWLQGGGLRAVSANRQPAKKRLRGRVNVT